VNGLYMFMLGDQLKS